MYVETQADAAFTLWLALRKPKTVEAERHNHLDVVEKRMLAYTRTMLPAKPRKPPVVKPFVAPVRQQFTDRQIEIAMKVLAGKESDTP